MVDEEFVEMVVDVCEFVVVFGWVYIRFFVFFCSCLVFCCRCFCLCCSCMFCWKIVVRVVRLSVVVKGSGVMVSWKVIGYYLFFGGNILCSLVVVVIELRRLEVILSIRMIVVLMVRVWVMVCENVLLCSVWK